MGDATTVCRATASNGKISCEIGHSCTIENPAAFSLATKTQDLLALQIGDAGTLTLIGPGSVEWSLLPLSFDCCLGGCIAIVESAESTVPSPTAAPVDDDQEVGPPIISSQSPTAAPVDDDQEVEVFMRQEGSNVVGERIVGLRLSGRCLKLQRQHKSIPLLSFEPCLGRETSTLK
jgi:hypothetical protein